MSQTPTGPVTTAHNTRIHGITCHGSKCEQKSIPKLLFFFILASNIKCIWRAIKPFIGMETLKLGFDTDQRPVFIWGLTFTYVGKLRQAELVFRRLIETSSFTLLKPISKDEAVQPFLLVG